MKINLYWRENTGAKTIVKENLLNMSEAAKARDALIKEKGAKNGAALIVREEKPQPATPAKKAPSNINFAKPDEEKPKKEKKKKQAKVENIIMPDPEPVDIDDIPEIDQSDDLAEKNNDE